MTGRIVLFGATGYTGELIARALVARGQSPVLAGRSAAKLAQLAADLGGDLGTQVADVERPQSVHALVERGDVLIATVGPFARWGTPALDAAIRAGAHYFDTTGEPSFIRQVFDRYGLQAQAAGSTLLTAAGFDWVPGNLAGALALRQAGADATRVEIGYFSIRGAGAAVSGGTQASSIGAVLDPSFAFRGGRIRTERTGARSRAFDVVPGQTRYALSVGGTEHFSLPAMFPALRDVDVLLGAAGPVATRAMPAASLALATAMRIPPVRDFVRSRLDGRATGSSGGPDATARAASSSVIIARARSGNGAVLADVRLEGVNGYTFTAEFLAWAAVAAASGALKSTGALGPVGAFGVDALTAAVEAAGIQRVR
jgi:short subunit dehydrogenase-like uncharacterized protein